MPRIRIIWWCTLAKPWVHWVHVHPQGGDKILLRQIYGGNCKCTPREIVHPRGRARFHFLGNLGDLDDRRGYLGIFSMCFEGDD